MADFAQLAQSLKDNEAFDAALTTIRKDALEALATMEHAEEAAFHKAQATIAVVDEIRGNLDAFIRGGKVPAKPGIA